MLDQPAHDRLDGLDRHPDWLVQAVFDPDEGGKDFAYTIGLHDRGLPELHLWARPDRGEDPGEYWMFSVCDRTRVLNELAWQLIDGAAGVGSELTRRYDDGLAVVHLRIEPPGDRELLEAFGIAPDAQVLPVSWSLTRPPEGALTGLDPDTETQALADYCDLVGRLDGARVAPRGWELPRDPSFDPDQRFGPSTPMVLARAAQLWQADAVGVTRLLGDAAGIAHHGSLTYPASMAFAVARSSGRRRACEEVQRAVDDLVAWITEHHSNRWLWRHVLESAFGPDALVGQVREWHRAASDLLRQVVLSGLLAEAMADVMADQWLLHGRGAWVSAFSATPGELPGPEWSASPEVIECLLDLLRPLSPQQLGEVATMHELALEGRDADGRRYASVVERLRARILTGAAGCPWAGALSTLPVWTSLAERLGATFGQVTIGPLVPLQEWASCVTAAMTHRLWLSDEEVRDLVRPFEEVLPDLWGLLNSPVAGSCGDLDAAV